MAFSPRTPPIIDSPIRLAVCVSGGGTTLQNLIDLIRARRLRAEIVQVVASRPRIGAIPRAEAAGIPLALASRPDVHTWSSAHRSSTRSPQPGRSRHPGRVPGPGEDSCRLQGPGDQHSPRADPAFCGKGYYGIKVHQAVIESGEGVRVHGSFRRRHLRHRPDHPPARRAGARGRHARSLAARVFKEECKALPEAIELYAAGRLKIVGRRVQITPPV